MLPALVLSRAIKAEFWRPLEKQGNISISVLSSTEWTRRLQKVANTHIGVILKKRRKCPEIHHRHSSSSSSSSLSHLFCSGSFSGTTTDTRIINTLLEPLLPIDLTFGTIIDIVSPRVCPGQSPFPFYPSKLSHLLLYLLVSFTVSFSLSYSLQLFSCFSVNA